MNYQFLVLSIKCTSNLIFLGENSDMQLQHGRCDRIDTKKPSQDLLLMDIVPSKIFTDA